MSRCERWQQAIPWYANGTLAPAERGELEAHVRRCESCRSSYELARRQATTAPDIDTSSVPHLPVSLLVRYVEEKALLSTESVQWVERHLEECDSCKVEVDLVTNCRVEDEAPRATGRSWKGVFLLLLRPTPALVYLLLLMVALPFLWQRQFSGPSVSERPPRIVEAVDPPLTTERARRAEGETLAPVVVTGDGLRRVDLLLDWARDDLRDVVSLSIELRHDGETLQQVARTPDRLVDTPEGLTITLWADYGVTHGDAVYEWQVRAESPGAVLDGQILFRRKVRVKP